MERLLCERCWLTIFNTQAAERYWNRENGIIAYTCSWQTIVGSAMAGCNWCSFQASVLPLPGSPEWPEGWSVEKELTVGLGDAFVMDNASPKGLNVCELDYGSPESPRDWHVEFDLSVGVNESNVEIPVTARPLQPVVDSVEAYSQIQRWVENCDSHPECAAKPREISLPSRVIEIDVPERSGEIRLHLAEHFEPPYLALSYCWGGDQTYVLTSANYSELKRNIDASLLPATIRDMVEVSNNLGVKYLWIDALCIMQNTNDMRAANDRDAELARMDQIYRNAFLTIVAACSPSVAGGFLRNRAVDPRKQFDIPCRLGDGNFFVTHICEHRQYDDRDEPINARAWTFQEQMLSPRLLIYASHTLQWQCRTLTCNLGDSYHAPNPSAAPRLPEPILPTFGGPESVLRRFDDVTAIPHILLQSWLTVVTAFSDRAISMPNDKLPAMSGLAATFYGTFGPMYHAGIWQKCAVQQLCWRRGSTKEYFKRPACQYRAPSWSWAALDGAVYFPSFLERDGASVCSAHEKFEIVGWQTALKSHGVPYGEVRGGSMTVAAVSRSGKLEMADPTPTIIFADGKSTSENTNRQSALAHVDVREEVFPRDVTCMAMHVVKRPQGLQVGGLILSNDEQEPHIFRRIGLFTTETSLFDGLRTQRMVII